MQKFNTMVPKVKPVSACKFDESVTEIASGKAGLIFYVGPVDCAGGTSCKIESGYLEGNLSASGNSYKAERREGKWIITEDQMNWIS
jgi:hypothetical protein